MKAFPTDAEKALFVASNATDDAVWHAASLRAVYGSQTGKLFSVYYVAACSGKVLGGAFGQTETRELPAGARLCRRCFAGKVEEVQS